MKREIYRLPDELREEMLKSFLNELIVKKTPFQKSLVEVNKKFHDRYKRGEISFFTTTYYFEIIFLDHLSTLDGFNELITTQSPIINMSKKELTKEQIIVKLFKKNFSVLKDFDKSIKTSVQQMKKNNYDIDELQFHNTLAKYMFKSLQAQLTNVLKFIKTASKEDLQTIIHEAQSSLST